MTNAETVPLDRPFGLWYALGLIEDVAAAAALSREPQIDLKGLPHEYHKNLEGMKLTIGTIVLASAEAARLLDTLPRRRQTRPLRRREASPIAGQEAEVESDQTEASLWAIRQSLNLVATLISTSAHSGGLHRDLVERATQELDADHVELVLYGTKLVHATSDAVLSSLSVPRNPKPRQGG